MARYENAVVSALLSLLSDLRKSQGLTLEGLAELAGVHRTTIGLLERQERHPTVTLAIQLATALGVPLSNLLRQAEEITESNASPAQDVQRTPSAREALREHFVHSEELERLTGLTTDAIRLAIDSCHYTLDIIDAQLTANGTTPIAKLVELANLSSMIGNLVGAGLAEASNGLYVRNRPHAYPDLVPTREPAVDVEIKVALETNRPKGHLAKEGTYITFRYVLGTREGEYVRGKESRGDTAWIWEARVGYLTTEDFSISNTEGDSGKTAVVKTESFNRMLRVYFVPGLSPNTRDRKITKDQPNLLDYS